MTMRSLTELTADCRSMKRAHSKFLLLNPRLPNLLLPCPPAFDLAEVEDVYHSSIGTLVPSNRSSLPTQDAGKAKETVRVKTDHEVACTVQYTICETPRWGFYTTASRSSPPKCTRCGKRITGKCVLTEGATFHKKCFTCDVSIPRFTKWLTLNKVIGVWYRRFPIILFHARRYT
jgi:hypothetical protein